MHRRPGVATSLGSLSSLSDEAICVYPGGCERLLVDPLSLSGAVFL